MMSHLTLVVTNSPLFKKSTQLNNQPNWVQPINLRVTNLPSCNKANRLNLLHTKDVLPPSLVQIKFLVIGLFARSRHAAGLGVAPCFGSLHPSLMVQLNQTELVEILNLSIQVY